MKKKHKYRSHMCLIANCPPEDLHNCTSQTAYRFVNNPITERNYKPPYGINPKRALEKNCQCEGWALSFFESQQQAEKRYRELEKFCKNIKESIGDHIASVDLRKDDGLVSSVSSSGHFDLFEWESADFAGRGKVLKQLA